MTAANTAAIYGKEAARSHPDGADAQRQLAETLEYCESKGLKEVVRYQDGKGNRDEFQRMIDDAASGEWRFDHVVVWKLMYFALMIEESILARDQLESHRVRVLAVKEKQRGE